MGAAAVLSVWTQSLIHVSTNHEYCDLQEAPADPGPVNKVCACTGSN